MADYPRSDTSKHPFLTVPKLYISQLPSGITDADVAGALAFCVPVRPQIHLDPETNTMHGEIDFKFLASAEKALATLHGRQLQPPSLQCTLVLTPFPPEHSLVLPVPRAQPRLIKQLPSGVTDAYLFDLFRPYGPIASICTQSAFGPDIGVVEFWEEDDAKAAEIELHCAEIRGVNISVQVYQPRRPGPGRSDFNVAAPPFVPSSNPLTYSPASPGGRLPYAPNYPYPASPNISESSMFHHGPGQQVQFAPVGSASHSGLIDPCNLFCKNLDLNIDSNDLFNLFRPYGHIVSARVMRGDNGNGPSRGFGFVSYQQPEQAAHALQSMNGQVIGGKQIQVRLHEPKQLRQEKLAQRFANGTNIGNRRTSGSSSPAISDAGEISSPPDRPRRGSGSYYNAALSGSLNLSWNYDELQSLSPVMRNDVLNGELRRKVRALQLVPPVHMDAAVENLLSLPLMDVVQGLHDSEIFASQVKAATEFADRKNGNSPLNHLVGLSSLPLSSPGTDIEPLGTIITPPVSNAQSGAATPASEQDRLAAAVGPLGFDAGAQAAIVELLLTLPRKERALCIFNQDYLKSKVAAAQNVLHAEDDTPSSNQNVSADPGRPTLPPVGNAKNAASEHAVSRVVTSPVTPSSQNTPSSLNDNPTYSIETSQHTLTSLAALPAKEIIRLINSHMLDYLPLSKADPLVAKSTDEFIDNLQGKPTHEQKQLLGEKLFKVIRAFGIKGAPKLTITLLDSEDLRALSHLTDSYPGLLKEKVLILGGKS